MSCKARQNTHITSGQRHNSRVHKHHGRTKATDQGMLPTPKRNPEPFGFETPARESRVKHMVRKSLQLSHQTKREELACAQEGHMPPSTFKKLSLAHGY